MLNQKFTNVRVAGKLKMAKGSSFVATSSAGVETTVDMTDLAVVGGLTASAAELNTMTGILATAAELNRAADLSTRVVVLGAASTLTTTNTLTLAEHDAKVIVLSNTHTQNVILPAATGSGAVYRFVVNVTGTDGSKVIKVANTYDAMTGVSTVNCTVTNEASAWLTTATDDTITLNNTTSGGRLGTRVEIIDIATSQFLVSVLAASTGTTQVTPFSAGV